MPAIAPIPPKVFKDVLVLAGWNVIREGRFNWVLVRGDDIIPLPKRGAVVDLEVMEG